MFMWKGGSWRDLLAPLYRYLRGGSGVWGGICVSSVLVWAARVEQSRQKAAALPWLRAPLPALETIDHLTGKAFPAWVYSALQSSPYWDVNSSPSNKSWAGGFGLVQFSPPFAAALGAATQGGAGEAALSPSGDPWDAQGCPGGVLPSWAARAAPSVPRCFPARPRAAGARRVSNSR